MNPDNHKPIKNRKLLLLCNPGMEEAGNYTPAVLNVLQRYKNYFMSAVGGSWIYDENEDLSEIIEEPAGYDHESEFTWLVTEITKIWHHADYSMIVFVGHGNAAYGNDRIQLSNGIIIPICSFFAPEPFGINTKRTVIIDACRTLQGAEQRQLILEQRSFSADDMLERDLCRNLYNDKIQECDPHIELIQSTQYGNPAYVNPEGTGTAFSDAFFDTLNQEVPQWNEYALGLRNGQFSVSLRSLMPEIQKGMRDYHQVPQYRRFGDGGGDFPFYSVLRPVQRL